LKEILKGHQTGKIPQRYPIKPALFFLKEGLFYIYSIIATVRRRLVAWPRADNSCCTAG
jgi:hypothetical protein